MPKATPGIPYTVVTGDNLSRLASQAYGTGSKWRLIYDANQSTLISSDPNLIFPVEVLQIPTDPAIAQISAAVGVASDEYLPEKEADSFTLMVSGKALNVQSARVIRTMDTIADGWVATLPWDPDDEELADVLKPFAYNEALAYVGPWLTVRGLLYTTRPKISTEGAEITLEGFSRTADLIDSSVKPPYEAKKITLEARAKALVEPLGILVNYEADTDEPFDRVTAKPSDKIFDHLAPLAAQRKVLMSSTIRGDIVFYQAEVGAPVGVITENFPPYQSMEAVFDGRKRFNSYRVTGPTPKRRSGNALEAFAIDENVPRSRFQSLQANDATAGNIQGVADWARSKQAAESMTLPFPVDSWYAPDGTLWRENTIVTVKSKTLFVPDGFDFLIRSVEYIFEKTGTTAILNLVPPQVYTGEPIKEPWA